MTEKKGKRKARIIVLGRPKTSAKDFEKEAMKNPLFIEMKKHLEKMRKKKETVEEVK